ncbi:MAG: SDR family oxidoreductase [Chloroflexi bacterium]|nr:SDR family oxidoreductase [Chloroflexota bacterium]
MAPGLDRLTGKRVVITGASSGIGEATAVLFAREGARVALLSRREDALEEVAGRIRADGGTALVLPCDVSKEDQVQAAFARAEEAWGGLDTVVGVAGVELYDVGDDRVDRLDLSVWQQTIDINLTGMFLTLKYGVQALLRAGGGAIVVTGSPTGLYGIALGEDAYSAAKAGCHGLARVVANEVARDGIRVNIVVPGLIDTPINARFKENHPEDWAAVNSLVPMRRAGLAEEVATMNLWLCTDEASYATGGYFTVDGGWTAI